MFARSLLQAAPLLSRVQSSLHPFTYAATSILTKAQMIAPAVKSQSLTFPVTQFTRGMAYVEKMKKYKPTSPGMRFRLIVDRSHLWKGKPHRPLTQGMRKKSGRNNQGRLCVYTKGGGHKRRYRFVDFQRAGEKTLVVERLEYDPNRSAWIALVHDQSNPKNLSYIIAPKSLDAGDIIVSGESVDIKVGNCLPLKNIPVGTLVHNVELRPGKGGQLARSAGCSAQIIKTGATGYATLRLSSNEQRLVSVNCRATIGTVSNSLHKNTVLGKAGASRWIGRRPTVRGVAMNPVDHPHGGGQGKTSGGRPSSSPWGVYTKGVRTRKNLKTDKYRVQRRKLP